MNRSMAPEELVIQVDQRFPVEDIRLDGLPGGWEFFRMHAYWEFVREQTGELKNDSLRQTTLPNHFRNWIAGCSDLRRPHRVIFLTDAGSLRKDKEDKWLNPFLGAIPSHFHFANCLNIEFGKTYETIKNRSAAFPTVSAIRLFAHLGLHSKRKMVSLEGIKCLDAIQQTYGLHWTPRQKAQKFLAAAEYFTRLFKRQQAKVLFAVCAYDDWKRAAIVAANSLGMKTVELQHGRIGKNHPGYFTRFAAHSIFYPQLLFVFGEMYKRSICVPENQYPVPKANIHAVGFGYLEDLLANPRPYPELENDPRKRILITHQWPIEAALVKLTQYLACQLPEMHFVFLPRNAQACSSDDFPPNVLYADGYDFYRLIGQCDIHLTCYSTCALEAAFAGKPNILWNFENRAKLNLSDLLSDTESNRYCADQEACLFAIRKLLAEKQTGNPHGSLLYNPGHQNLIERVLTECL